MDSYLEVPDGICDDRLLLRDAGGEERQRGGEGQRGLELLVGGALLLELLQEQDELHANRRQAAAVGAVEAAVAQEGPQKGLQQQETNVGYFNF